MDFAHPEQDLTASPLVVVPALYLAAEAAGANLRAYVEQGGTLVVSYFSGIVDGDDRVHPGPYPGALRDVPDSPSRSSCRSRRARRWSWSRGRPRRAPERRPVARQASRRAAASGPRTWFCAEPNRCGPTPKDRRPAAPPSPATPAHANLFAINHTAAEAKVPLERPGAELLTGERAAGHLAVPAGAVRVVRLDA